MKSFSELAKERRSVNFFDSSKQIEGTVLKDIIELASLSPSAFNLQPWRIIAVQSPEGKAKLMALANGQPKVAEASVALIVVGDRLGYEDSNPVWDELESLVGKEGTEGAKGAAKFLYGSSEERQIKFAESNGGLLSMSLMYAAKELGVDSHPMSGVDFDGIKEAFNLKPSEAVVMVIGLGYFDASKELYGRRARKSFESITELV